jgi:cellobiose transport system permease protein
MAISSNRAAAPTAREPLSSRFDRVLSPYVFIAPFFIVFGLFGLIPLLFTGWVSLFAWNPIGKQEFIGLDNYFHLVADSRFWNATFNTISIWVLTTIPQLFLALGLATVLNNAVLRFKTGFRMSMLIPNVTSVVAVGIVFASLFGRDYGLINWVIGLFGFAPIDWQVGTLSSHVAIATMVEWRWTGYWALIFLAAMQAVPRELYEVAAIDGASRLRQFRSVTIPQLRGTIIFMVTISTIGGLQVFAEPLIFGGQQNDVTGGVARQFQTLSLFLYEQGFRSFKFGYASAIAWVLFLIVLVFSLVNLVFTRRISSSD